MPSFIDILKYLLLGFVQGVAEILPISSSGHLALFQSLLGVNAGNEDVFAIFVHFASLVALLIFFRKLVWRLIKGTCLFLFKKDKAYKHDFLLVVYLVIATIPAALLGYLFEDFFTAKFGNLLFIGIAFIVTAGILFGISFIKDSKNDTYTWKNTLIAGLFQVIGIFPGISRSGITMSGGKIAGLSNDKAKEFAFLLFIPVAAGSFILSLGDVSLILQAQSSTVILYGLSALASGAFTFLALLYIFKRFSIKHYKYFSIYLIVVGIFTIICSLL